MAACGIGSSGESVNYEVLAARKLLSSWYARAYVRYVTAFVATGGARRRLVALTLSHVSAAAKNTKNHGNAA